MTTDWPGNVIERYAGMARPLYVGKDPAHDWSHIERIWSRLPWLGSEFHEVDVDRAAFLTAFHGLQDQVRSDTALRGAVVEQLAEQGRSDAEIDELLLALDRHTAQPLSPEEVVVHDANVLEVIGAFGIAKAFTKGGAEGQSYEETIAFYRGFLARATFFTQAARSVEAERRAYAEAFLSRFAAEDSARPT